MAFTLPNLPYAYDALEPNIDSKTMEIHHSKHHNAYVTKLNEAISGTDLENKSLEALISSINALAKDKQAAVRNNGGGHYNHSLFWTILGANSPEAPSGELASAITKKFSSLESFKEQFANAAATRFGSGWAWLIVTANGELAVSSTPNQDNPIMDVAEVQGTPILGLDVWEHAYYLNYQNRRPDYISAFWDIVNWTAVEKRFAEAKQLQAA